MNTTDPINKRPDAVTSIRDAIRSLEPQLPPEGAKKETLTISIAPAKVNKRRAPKLPPPLKIAEETPYSPAPGSLADGSRLLNVKTANQWLDEQRLRPSPRKLFGNFWLEGELCLLFADTNMGKSILAVQIGDAISRRVGVAPFEHDAIAAPVLYIDFELNAKQFELRYHDAGGIHRFSNWFYRAEYNALAEVPDRYASFDAYMRDNLDWAIRNTEPKTLIIDNITCLSEGSHQTAARAIGLMKYLKTLQTKNRLNILVLAHTPKRAAGKPIGRDDMGGSKMLMNFADSAFAIGQSNLPGGLRYLKQVKQRSGGQQYGEDNICLMDLTRDKGFLYYQFKGYGHERDHLRAASQPLPSQITDQVTALHQQGLSQRKIAARLKISLGVVNKVLGRAKSEECERKSDLVINIKGADSAL